MSGDKSSLIQKWKQISNWLKNNSALVYSEFNRPADPALIEKIEGLTNEPFPEELKLMYGLHNGETGKNCGTFFGSAYMELNRSIETIEFGKNLVKPVNRTIDDPVKSDLLINKIVEFYRGQITDPVWYKLKFSCSENSFSGPYLYSSETTTNKERKIVRIEYDKSKNLNEAVTELHALEKKGYNWDELEFVLYYDGKYDLERKDYNFNDEISFTSYPEGAIKKNYFNPKWIPVFDDGSGNYIGIDLDPDVNGKKGQVIIFGRDEQNMTVISDTLEGLFDLCLAEISKNENNPSAVSLLEESHIHEILRDLRVK